MLALISVSDLISTKTIADWKQSIINTATLVGLKTENWSEGGYTRTLLALFTQLYKTGGDVVKALAASAFLDTATGGWLTLLANQVFDVDRIEATHARAVDGITLVNNGGDLFEFDPGDIVVAQASGKTYRNTSAGTLNAGFGQTLKLDLEAEEAGSGSTANVGAISVLVTTFIGVTCSNEVALIGLDEETDPALRIRCRESIALRSIGGIKKAYDFIAKTAKRSDGTAIGVTRVRTVPPPGDGTLAVYVAQASGALFPEDVAIIQDAFDNTVSPYGINATAISAVNRPVTVPCTIWIPSAMGWTAAEAQQAVHDALRAYVNSLPIGGVIIAPDAGKIFWRAVLGVVERSIEGMLKAQLASEADVTLTIGQVPVWAGVTGDTTVVQVI